MDNEEIVFPSGGIRRVYDYKPYTIHRIRRIFEEYGCRLETVGQEYKANRRWNYCALYRIVQNEDNQVLTERISLYQLQKFCARQDFPLHDEKSLCNKKARNQKAEDFLKIVENLRNKQCEE